MGEVGTDQIVIVGGGFSGAMLAARLAERGQRSTVIGRDDRFGLGVAYSTPFEGHLLNVRSSRMSAVEGRPADFVDWLKANRPELADPEDFAPRAVYGCYLADRFGHARATGLIQTVQGAAVAVEAEGVRLADGRRIEGRAVVLATGNPAPRTAETGASDRILSDPWAPGALERIGADDRVLIVGTGLTMVDMLQSLEAGGWRGRATALSRRGLLPRAHGEQNDAATDLPDPALKGPMSARLKAARAKAGTAGWKPVMEAYRPITADLWSQATVAERARLVRHLRPWWDVHRHRVAARIGRFLERLNAEGRLTIIAGRLGRVEADGTGVRAAYRPRGGGAPGALQADWLIDCTGPGHDAARDLLTGPLIAAGRARLDPLRLGLDLDAEGRVLDAQGRSDDALYVLGPPARAAFWETIAVPDIRKRIEALADRLTPAAPHA
jgi:uncharacterized NAD(P)/FAD-binding protein YdhS